MSVFAVRKKTRRARPSSIPNAPNVAALQATVVYVKNRKPFPASVEIFGPRMICQKRMAGKFLAKTWPKSCLK
jgi:hypothetical protein